MANGLIPNQTWNEDGSLDIDLSQYFSDPDGDILTYSIYNTSENKNITLLFLADKTLRFESSADWYGDDWAVLRASDTGGQYILSNKITLTVNPVNDAPVLNPISNIDVVEGQIAEITATASDKEEGILNYSINDTRFQKDSNTFRWQTLLGNSGEYKIKISVEDNQGAVSSRDASITVMPKSLINEFVSNPVEGNDWIELYNPGNSSLNLSICRLEDGATNTLGLNGVLSAKGFLVFEWSNKMNNAGDAIELHCNGRLTDKISYGNWDDGNITDNSPAPEQGESAGRDPDGKDTNVDVNDFKIFSYPTKGLANNADVVVPITTLISPENGSFFNNTRRVELNFTATDDKDNDIGCFIYIRNALAGSLNVNNGTMGSFILNNLIDGYYLWNVRCFDGTNYAYAKDNRTFQISAPDNPILSSIGQKTTNENQTLTFDVFAADPDSDGITLIAENLPKGAEFTDNDNGTGRFIWIPDYEQSGAYNLKFTVRDASGLEASETVKIIVNNIKAPPKFSDIKLCKDISPNLTVTIQDPDDGDGFMIGDLIEGTVEIENDADKDLDADLDFYLYDITEEEVIEKASGAVDVDEGDSEEVEFKINIPEDAEEDHEFAVFVKAKDDDCNQAYNEIEIEREEHKVIIEEFTLNPKTAGQGTDVEIVVKIKNLGEEDETVYVKLENNELDLSKKSEEVELENYWDDNEKIIEFSFNIPENSDEKDYEIKAAVFFDNEKNSRSEILTVVEKIKEELTTMLPLINAGIDTTSKTAGGTVIYLTGSVAKKSSGKEIVLDNAPLVKKTAEKKTAQSISRPLTFDEYLIIIDGILIGGIILEILCIFLIKNRRIGMMRRRRVRSSIMR